MFLHIISKNIDLIYKSTILDKMISTYKEILATSETDTIKKQLIKNFNVIVICSTGSPFGFIYNVIKNDFIDKDITKINMFFIVGRDRADFLDIIVDNFTIIIINDWNCITLKKFHKTGIPWFFSYDNDKQLLIYLKHL